MRQENEEGKQKQNKNDIVFVGKFINGCVLLHFQIILTFA
jgi:hypothetical protein